MSWKQGCACSEKPKTEAALLYDALEQREGYQMTKPNDILPLTFPAQQQLCAARSQNRIA
jgi:hypothetical protein